MTKTTSFVDYYQILNLPFGPSTSLTKQQLKLAYHKALLRHHPDKAGPVAQNATTLRTTSPSPSPSTPMSQDKFTIDEITTAYKTLTDPSLRAEYDRVLRLDRVKGAEREKTVFHTGLEVVDLEDLGCDDESGEEIVWFRGCRCGDERGFMVTEDELEKEVEHGEIVVGCRGCSLWLKVLFAVEDDG